MKSSKNESSMLRDSEENEYPYSKSDAQKMLDKLFEEGLIGLPKSKCLEEVGRNDDPKFCKYQRSSAIL